MRAVVKQPSPNCIALSLAGNVSCGMPLIKNMMAPFEWANSLAGRRAVDKGIKPNKKGPTSGPFLSICREGDRPPRLSASDLLKDQRTVGAAKAEGVTQGVLQTADLTRFVRNEVQIATVIRVIQVDGWRNSLIAQRKDGVD